MDKLRDIFAAEIAAGFDTHPSVDKFYVTSDGTLFFDTNHADAHSQVVGDRKVEEVNRPAADAVAASAEEDGKPAEPTKEEKAAAALQLALDTPEDQRTSHQKGLITKANKAKAEQGTPAEQPAGEPAKAEGTSTAGTEADNAPKGDAE